MKGFDLVITLHDDCVFSERNATEGAHTALDYIPGGALLGAVAAKLYQADNLDAAFDWFHSGKLRFSNAYPLTKSGQRTYPIPACWHEAKNKSATEGAKIDDAKVWRLDKREKMELPDNEQPKQIRQGYVAVNGDLAEPEKQLRMKTAIDADTGRAKEGVLFGYDSLQAGQRFYAQIQIDNELSADAFDAIEQVFKQPLLLGRSRSAEYGRASAEVIKQTDDLSAGEASRDNRVTLWLQSDLMVMDQYGQPTLCPSSKDLGLPAGAFLAGESFLRTRRYSTWNAYKRGYEMERQVICKGGVLVYQLEAPLEDKHLEMIGCGLGLERQAGLGQVWLNPEMLAGEKPHFNKECKPVAETSGANKQAKIPEVSPLIEWLRSREKGSGQKQDQANEARKLAKEYLGFMQSARKLKGLDSSVFVGPSSSQWGGLSSLINSAGSNGIQQITESRDGLFKPNGEGWSDEFQDKNNNIISFYQWFTKLMTENPESYFLSQIIREITGKLKSVKGGQS